MLTPWWPEKTRLLDGSEDDQSEVAVGAKTINRGKKIYHGGRRPP